MAQRRDPQSAWQKAQTIGPHPFPSGSMSAAEPGTALPPMTIMEAGVPDERAVMLRAAELAPKAKSFWQLGQELLGRFGTQSAPTMEEIGGVLEKAKGARLNELEQLTKRQLEGRLRLATPKPKP